MSLKKITLLTRGEVQVGDETIYVTGLSAAQIVAIVDRNRQSSEKVFEELSGDKGDALLKQPEQMAAKFLKDAPDLIADIIATATMEEGDDHSEELELAKKLSVGLQIKLIEKLIEVTTFVEGGLGELLETVLAAIVGGSAVVKKLQSVPRR